MGSFEANSDCKGEMDDSGCVEDGSPPSKKMCMDQLHTEIEETPQVHLLDLSDDVLLGIFQHCNAFDLKALAYTCSRLSNLVRDRTLWRRVDARARPVGRSRLKWFTGILSDSTTELMLSGYARDADGCLGHVMGDRNDLGGGGDAGAGQSEPPATETAAGNEGASTSEEPSRGEPPYPLYRQHARLHINAYQLPRMSGAPAWSDHHATVDDAAAAASPCAGPQFTVSRRSMQKIVAACPSLTHLALEYCNINCSKVSISDFPPTLTKLSLKGTKCYNMPTDKTYLFRIHDSLPLLEHLDLSSCLWVEPVSLLPLSKARRLRTLLMRDCLKMTEFVAYAALAYRYGFRSLKVLDMRGSPIGDSEVTGLGWAPELEELYLAPPRDVTEPQPHAHRHTDPLAKHIELDPWETEKDPYCNGEEEKSTQSSDEEARGNDIILDCDADTAQQQVIEVTLRPRRAGEEGLRLERAARGERGEGERGPRPHTARPGCARTRTGPTPRRTECRFRNGNPDGVWTAGDGSGSHLIIISDPRRAEHEEYLRDENGAYDQRERHENDANGQQDRHGNEANGQEERHGNDANSQQEINEINSPRNKKMKRSSNGKRNNNSRDEKGHKRREENDSNNIKQGNNVDQSVCDDIQESASYKRKRRVQDLQQGAGVNICYNIKDKNSNGQVKDAGEKSKNDDKNTDKKCCNNNNCESVCDISNEAKAVIDESNDATSSKLIEKRKNEVASEKEPITNTADPQPSCSKSKDEKTDSFKIHRRASVSSDSDFDSSDDNSTPGYSQIEPNKNLLPCESNEAKSSAEAQNNKASDPKYVTLMRKINDDGTHYVTFKRQNEDQEAIVNLKFPNRNDVACSSNEGHGSKDSSGDGQASKDVSFQSNSEPRVAGVPRPCSSSCSTSESCLPRVLNFGNDIDVNNDSFITFKRATDPNGVTFLTVKRKSNQNDNNSDAKRRINGDSSDSDEDIQDNNNTGERDENSNSVRPMEPVAGTSREAHSDDTVEQSNIHRDESSPRDGRNEPNKGKGHNSKETNANKSKTKKKSKKNTLLMTRRIPPQGEEPFIVPHVLPNSGQNNIDNIVINPAPEHNVEHLRFHNQIHNQNNANNNIEIIDAEPRHHILYVNVSHQLRAVYRLNRPVLAVRSRNRALAPIFSAHIEYASLVSDAAIRRFGRAEDEDDINFVNIGPNGPVAARDAGARPDRSNLRILEATGYRHITDRSLVHLATAAPNLQRVNFTDTNVTEAGVERFKSLRPDVEVIFSKFEENN